MIIVSKHLVPSGYTGMAIYPFIIVKSQDLKRNKALINHERIHLMQQLELLIFPFFVWYLLEFLYRYIKEGNWHTAYRNISFEREAYDNEEHLGYLKKRQVWNFLKYLCKA